MEIYKLISLKYRNDFNVDIDDIVIHFFQGGKYPNG